MAFDQVNWQFIEGAKAFFTFGNMLGAALSDANVPVLQKSYGWEYRGHYTVGKKFWVGVYFECPSLLLFSFSDAEPDEDKLEEVGRFQMGANNYRLELDLNSEAVHFFARTAEDQLAYLTDWLRNAYRDGLRCIRDDARAEKEGRPTEEPFNPDQTNE